MTWPMTSQSNSMRSAARCCFTVGGVNCPSSFLMNAATWKGSTAASSRMPRRSHHVAKRRVTFIYALRVWSLLIWVAKNSTTRLAAFGVGANSGAGRNTAGAGEGTRAVGGCHEGACIECYKGALSHTNAGQQGKTDRGTLSTSGSWRGLSAVVDGVEKGGTRRSHAPL